MPRDSHGALLGCRATRARRECPHSRSPGRGVLRKPPLTADPRPRREQRPSSDTRRTGTLRAQAPGSPTPAPSTHTVMETTSHAFLQKLVSLSADSSQAPPLFPSEPQPQEGGASPTWLPRVLSTGPGTSLALNRFHFPPWDCVRPFVGRNTGFLVGPNIRLSAALLLARPVTSPF